MGERDEMGLGSMKEVTRDSEGVIVGPLALEDGILRIKYYEGTNKECPEV